MKSINFEDDYLSNIYKKGTDLERSFLAHHGILGMKWGIRRFQNKDGTRTPEGKERYSKSASEDSNEEKSSIAKKLEDRGYTKNSYGRYEKEIISPNDNVKSLTIDADIDRKIGEAISDDEYMDLLNNIEKNYNNIQIAMGKSMADFAFENRGDANSIYSEFNLSLDEKKTKFINLLGTQMDFNTGNEYPGYAYIRVMGDGYGEFGIDAGGAYGDHWLTTEIDWKNEWKKPKVKYFSVEG